MHAVNRNGALVNSCGGTSTRILLQDNSSSPSVDQLVEKSTWLQGFEHGLKFYILLLINLEDR